MGFTLMSVVIFAILVSTSWAKQEDSFENDEMQQRLAEEDIGTQEEFLGRSLEQVKRVTGEISKRFISVGVGVRISFWRKRRSADEPTIKEKDNFMIDPEKKIVVDQMSHVDGKEVTVSDYNLGVMAVLKSGDKICHLHKLPEVVKRVDLNQVKEYLYALSKTGKMLNLIQVSQEEFEYSSKRVLKEDVGSKIEDACKKYKMVWMKPAVAQAEKRENADDQTIDAIDTFLDEDNTEVKRSKAWICGRACNTFTWLNRSFPFCRYYCA